MRERIETILTVILVTVLVWLYAEGRVVSVYTDQQIGIRFETRSGAPIDYQGPDRISVSFKASPAIKREFDQLAEQPLVLTIDDTVPGFRDSQVLLLDEELARTELFDLGIAIQDSNPATADIEVIRLETITVPIRVTTLDFELSSATIVEPASATLTYPVSLSITEDQAYALAELGAADIAGLAEGEERTQTVRLLPSPATASRFTAIEPQNARVTFSYRQANDSLQLTAVPLRLSLPIGLAEDFALSVPESDRFLPSITLTGPIDAIAEARAGEQSVYVELRPTRDQLEAAADAQPPILVLMPVLVAPENLTADAESLLPVTITVSRRTTALPR